MSYNVATHAHYRFEASSIKRGSDASGRFSIVTLRITVRAKPTREPLVVSASLVAFLRGHAPTSERYYAYLMTHSLEGKKTDAHIGYTTNPAHELYLCNNQLKKDRATNAAAPHWRVARLIGPFPSSEAAIACTQDWVDGTRGKDSKCYWASFLARLHDANLYSADAVPDEPFEQYLERVAPPLYVETYRRMKAKRESSKL